VRTPRGPALEARIIALTQQPAPPPATHLPVRRLAQRVGASPWTVHRVWQRACLWRRWFRHCRASPPTLNRNDPALPLAPSRAERHAYGTRSLCAALEVGVGHVEGRATTHHARRRDAWPTALRGSASCRRWLPGCGGTSAGGDGGRSAAQAGCSARHNMSPIRSFGPSGPKNGSANRARVSGGGT